MERRTFLKILSSAGIVSLVSPAFAMGVCRNKVSKSSSYYDIVMGIRLDLH